MDEDFSEVELSAMSVVVSASSRVIRYGCSVRVGVRLVLRVFEKRVVRSCGGGGVRERERERECERDCVGG